MKYQSERRLSELAAFAAVVEHGGFSAAARAGGLRKATLLERVSSLEARLDVTLVSRTTRALRVTDEGLAFAAAARRALAAVGEAEAAAVEMRAKPSGTLRVSIAPPLAGALVQAVVAPYMRENPDVSVEVDASARTVDIVREGFDLAIRVGRLPDSSLTLRRLGHASGGYYASPAYVARRGSPEKPEDLAHHDTIAMPRGDRLAKWHFVSGRRRRTVVVRPHLVLTSFELAIEAAVAGLGVVPCTQWAARSYLAKKALVPILAPWTPPLFEVNALFASGAVPPKTRAMLDALSTWFAARQGRI